MKHFYEEIECDHGEPDNRGSAHCNLGAEGDNTCDRDCCPIYDTDDDDEGTP